MCISKKYIKHINKLIPIILLAASTFFVIYITISSITSPASENSKIAEGTLEILAFTLITLLFYTYYTYRMAVKKEHPTIVATIGYISQFRDVRVMLKNPTNLYAETHVYLSVKIYGQEARLAPE
jgi:hypothetical protein